MRITRQRPRSSYAVEVLCGCALGGSGLSVARSIGCGRFNGRGVAVKRVFSGAVASHSDLGKTRPRVFMMRIHDL